MADADPGLADEDAIVRRGRIAVVEIVEVDANHRVDAVGQRTFANQRDVLDLERRASRRCPLVHAVITRQDEARRKVDRDAPLFRVRVTNAEFGFAAETERRAFRRFISRVISRLTGWCSRRRRGRCWRILLRECRRRGQCQQAGERYDSDEHRNPSL